MYFAGGILTKEKESLVELKNFGHFGLLKY
jgi:ATP adenylyltransferase/5',5'''-P-1,P-4-tetraphosphate phosphorylase II